MNAPRTRDISSGCNEKRYVEPSKRAQTKQSTKVRFFITRLSVFPQTIIEKKKLFYSAINADTVQYDRNSINLNMINIFETIIGDEKRYYQSKKMTNSMEHKYYKV